MQIVLWDFLHEKPVINEFGGLPYGYALVDRNEIDARPLALSGRIKKKISAFSNDKSLSGEFAVVSFRERNIEPGQNVFKGCFGYFLKVEEHFKPSLIADRAKYGVRIAVVIAVDDFLPGEIGRIAG